MNPKPLTTGARLQSTDGSLYRVVGGPIGEPSGFAVVQPCELIEGQSHDLPGGLVAKVLRADVDDGFVKRFEREAEIARRLQWDGVGGIVPVLARGRVVHSDGSHGRHFFIMRHVRNASSLGAFGDFQTKLRQLVDGAKILHAAHARGLVHRDVKPDNFLIAEGGQVFLLDFGLAGVRESTAASVLRTMKGSRTIMSMGYTPGFAPPEQLLSENLQQLRDPRVDVFAMASTVHAVLFGGGIATPYSASFIEAYAEEPNAVRQPAYAEPAFPDGLYSVDGQQQASAELRRAISLALEFDPRSRSPDLVGLLDALEFALVLSRRHIRTGGAAGKSSSSSSGEPQKTEPWNRGRDVRDAAPSNSTGLSRVVWRGRPSMSDLDWLAAGHAAKAVKRRLGGAICELGGIVAGHLPSLAEIQYEKLYTGGGKRTSVLHFVRKMEDGHALKVHVGGHRTGVELEWQRPNGSEHVTVLAVAAETVLSEKALDQFINGVPESRSRTTTAGNLVSLEAAMQSKLNWHAWSDWQDDVVGLLGEVLSATGASFVWEDPSVIMVGPSGEAEISFWGTGKVSGDFLDGYCDQQAWRRARRAYRRDLIDFLSGGGTAWESE